MKRFKFKLESVLAERQRIEDLRQREWTIAKRILAGMMEDLAGLERELSDAIGKGDELAGAGVLTGIGMFGALDKFIAGQKLRIIWKGQEIERGAKLTEARRMEYVKARQKREALTKLKERKLTAFKDEVAKREAKALDDIYIMSGAARRRMNEEEEMSS